MSGDGPAGRCRAIGLMSGTSLDGIDAALIETDGEQVFATGPSLTIPYSKSLRERLRAILGRRDPVPDIERALTEQHATAVEALLRDASLKPADIRVVGFHGHTLLHRPQERYTRQIGDGALLARLTGIDVVNDFRTADVAAGGEGAPLVPAYHQALARTLEQPLAVLNIGGIANVTYVGAGQLIAFDTGPGNALLDQWTEKTTGNPYDAGGALAALGTPNKPVLDRLMQNPFFRRKPPKSLDRLDFDLVPLDGLSPSDGAATLAAFTCRAVGQARDHLPEAPRRWLVTGGGRHNDALMQMLAQLVAAPVAAVESVGWDGDALEAQAFGFLAVRSLRGLPLSYPTTTGVPRAMTGGTHHARSN